MRDKHGQLKEGTNNVKEIVHEYYKTLYTNEPEDEAKQDELLQNIDKIINEDQKSNMDAPIENDELKQSLKDLQNNKSPGNDGLTKEFYLFFWNELEIPFKKMLDDVKRSKEMTNSQKRGIIRIIYKKNGVTFIKNYRPISLLNVDLKILTRTLAKRLSLILEEIIHKSQKAVPGRHITTNINIMQDIIDAINNENSEAAFIFLDQEKAIDRISHNFIFKTLRKFGIGEDFIEWVKIIYTDTKGSVKINVFLTDEFDIKRGVRQGCPLSALLYVLCAEVLGTAIRKNTNIKGYKYQDMEYKRGQYADDMNVLVTTDESIYHLFETIKIYEQATNAKINEEKSEGLMIGKWKNRSDKPFDLKWTNKGVKSLGVYVGNDRNEMAKRGFEEKKEKVKNSLIFWPTRTLSLKGRVFVLNTFILSQLWYICECQDIPKTIQNDLEKMILDFVWNRKKHHQTNKKTLSSSFDKGGPKLVDIHEKTKTYRNRWIFEVLKASDDAIVFFLVYKLIGSQKHISQGLNILKYNDPDLTKGIKNEFYRNSIKYIFELNISYKPKNAQSIENDSIYYNKLLKDENGLNFRLPKYLKFDNIPKYVPIQFKDLPIKTRSMKKEYNEQNQKINTAYGKMQNEIKYENKDKDYFVVLKNDEEIEIGKTTHKDIYTILISKIEIQNKSAEKWENFLALENEWTIIDRNIDLNWKKIWQNIHDSINTYMVQSSIWEMINLNFICPTKLIKMFPESYTTKCSLCNKNEENESHIFMKCEAIILTYNHFDHILQRLDNQTLNQNEMAFGIYQNITPKRRIRNYLTYAIRHSTFKLRKINFQNPILASKAIIKKTRTFIRNDLGEKMWNSLQKNKTENVSKLYLVENILGYIQNNIVYIDL